jgi:hypothetical protein
MEEMWKVSGDGKTMWYVSEHNGELSLPLI